MLVDQPTGFSSERVLGPQMICGERICTPDIPGSQLVRNGLPPGQDVEPARAFNKDIQNFVRAMNDGWIFDAVGSFHHSLSKLECRHLKPR